MFKRNRNIVYDENTKIISVKPNCKNTLQLFLERNKIYFETIMMLALSIAGIIVSIVSVRVAITANEISLDEKMIADLEKQPAFVYNQELDGERIKYIINNVGGDIKYGNVFVDKVLIVTIHDENFYYIGKGYIFLKGYWENSFSTYDRETNSFELYYNLEPKPVWKWIEKVEEVIKSQGFYCNIESAEYFDFMYTDYKQEMINKTMITHLGIICNTENNGDYEFKIFANLDDLYNEQINEELTEELKNLILYNNNKKNRILPPF